MYVYTSLPVIQSNERLRCRVDVLARTRLASQKNRSIVSYVVFFGEDQPKPQVTGKRSTVNCSSLPKASFASPGLRKATRSGNFQGKDVENFQHQRKTHQEQSYLCNFRKISQNRRRCDNVTYSCFRL